MALDFPNNPNNLLLFNVNNTVYEFNATKNIWAVTYTDFAGAVTTVNGQDGIVLLYTANIPEAGNNLYFTNTRARNAISVTGSGTYDSANGLITIVGGVSSINNATGNVVITTANIAESGNLYYTDARVFSNIVTTFGAASNAFVNARFNAITTQNVTEVSNLYFTNARARGAISVTGSGTYDSSTGVITVVGGVSTVGGYSGNISNAQIATVVSLANVPNLTVTGNVVLSNVIFTVPNTTNTISLRAVNSSNVGAISFLGNAGELFSITDNLVGTIFSVNDISGIPSIEVNSDGRIMLGAYSGNVLVGSTTDVGGRLQVSGDLYANVIEVLDGTVTVPSISFFNDLNTGFYRTTTDSIGVTTGGTLRLTVDTAAFTGTLPWRGQDGSATDPAFSFSGDTNTGMFRTTTDSLGFTAGGTNRLTIDTTALTPTLPILGPNGSVSAPTFSFSGDTNTGIYWSSADQLSIAAGGSEQFRVTGSFSYSPTRFYTGDGSAGAPAFSFFNDTNTGFYRYTTDQMSFVSGATESFRTSASWVFFPLNLLLADGSAGSPQLRFNNDGSTGMYRDTSFSTAFSANGTRRANINSLGVMVNGNVYASSYFGDGSSLTGVGGSTQIFYTANIGYDANGRISTYRVGSTNTSSITYVQSVQPGYELNPADIYRNNNIISYVETAGGTSKTITIQYDSSNVKITNVIVT